MIRSSLAALVALALLATAPAVAQRPSPTAFDPRVAEPAYPVGAPRRPRVLFDQAHFNGHGPTDRYRGFADLIRHDGYDVTVNTKRLDPQTLSGHAILIIATPQPLPDSLVNRFNWTRPALTAEECDRIHDWVQAGGALLLITGHAPRASWTVALAARFAVEVHDSYAADSLNSETPEATSPRGAWIIYTRDNGLLRDHVITNGRSDRERLRRVRVNGAASVAGPPGSEAFLELGPSAYEWIARDFAFWPEARFTTASASGRAQGIALRYGAGRVVVLAPAALFTEPYLVRPDTDHRQLALNVMHWLSGLAVVARPVPPAGKVIDAATFPRFNRVLLLETTSETSANVSIGDVNGDGNLDIVLAKGRHWPLVDRVLLGDGHGRFPAAHDLGATPDRTYSGRLADIDGDGDLDVVISNDRPDPKLVYVNDGTGYFHVGSTYGRAEWPTRNASIADLNGDGRPDIIVANRGGAQGANYICLNRGNGRFDADCTAFSEEPATTITPADFNRDGLTDLAVPHRNGGQSYLYVHDARATNPTFRRIPFGPPDATIRVSEAADLDGDGRTDIVAIDERRGVAVYFGLASDTFSAGAPVGAGTSTPYALAVADLNRDGKVDIIVGHVQAPSTIYFNDGSGRRFTPVHFGDDKGTAYGFAIGDLDRDGLPDIAAARSDAPNVVYFADP